MPVTSSDAPERQHARASGSTSAPGAAPRPPHRKLVLAHVVTVPLSLRFLAGQTRYMRQRGYEVHTVSSPGSMVDEFVEREGSIAHTMNLTRSISPRVDALALVKLWWLFLRLRPDIVHANTPKGGLVGTVAAYCAGVPVRIYHARGLRLATMSGATRLVLATTERITCALATDVLCNSRSLREEFIELGLGKADKLRVLLEGSGNGVDIETRFNPKLLPRDIRSRVLERHALPADAELVGFVGRIVRDKGIVELCEAWQSIRAAFPQAYLMLVGPYDDTDPIPPEVKERLEGDVRVRLVPFTENIAEYYAAMDLLVLPTYREGFANALLEAGAMSLAAVTTRVTGCTDPIEDGKTGALVPARDAAALQKAIERYLLDPELRRAHGAAARQRIERYYRQEPLWDALEEFYQECRKRPRQVGWKLLAKKSVDKVAAATVLLGAAPLIGATALAIALTMGRPVLFTQPRAGFCGRVFRVFKFRTMLDATDAQGQLLPDDQRLTRLGRLIRDLSLDELPQLINILRGEMSLVGPRPLLVKYLDRYTPEQARRHDVLPGITGWTAVNGRNSLRWGPRFELDTWYVDHWSLLLDAEILLKTVVAVLKREGVNRAENVTMPEFVDESS